MTFQLVDSRLLADTFAVSSQGLILLRRRAFDDFEILATNSKAAEYGGWPFDHQSVVGQNIVEVFPGIRDHGLLTCYNEALDTGEPVDIGELSYEDSVVVDGIFACVFVPVDERHLVVEFRNVTELVRTRDELIRSKQELEEFAFAAAHDLRSPVQKVQALIDIMREDAGSDDGDTLEYCATEIGRSADRMANLIDDLLALARIRSDVHGFGPVDLQAELEQVVDELDPSLERNATIDIGVLPLVHGQPVLLRQLFRNLIENGLKYRKPSTPPIIRVRASLDEPPGGIPAYRITVEDNGVGFDERHAEDIFKIFKRLDNNDRAGTGIGLALCRRIASQHHGSIWASSEPDSGSCFTVALPVGPLDF